MSSALALDCGIAPRSATKLERCTTKLERCTTKLVDLLAMYEGIAQGDARLAGVAYGARRDLGALIGRCVPGSSYRRPPLALVPEPREEWASATALGRCTTKLVDILGRYAQLSSTEDAAYAAVALRAREDIERLAAVYAMPANRAAPADAVVGSSKVRAVARTMRYAKNTLLGTLVAGTMLFMPQGPCAIVERNSSIVPTLSVIPSPPIGMDASSSCHSPALSPIIETRTVMPPPFAHAAAPGPFIPAHAPIFMYHGIGPREDRFTVSPERLRAHLDTLREDGRTLLTFHEYAGRTPYARASRPAILTFDDSTEGQFRFLPGGGIDPSSAVGVLESYRRAHPEFRVTATFFVNTTTMRGLPAFEQPGLAERKLRFLAARGYEIAGHGTTHRDFATLRAIDARSDTDEFLSMMARAVPGYAVRSFAYPYGSLPPCAVRSTMESRFFTAHAWGGVANGQSWTVPRIETGPTTDLRAYLR